MENMKIWDALKAPPKSALKKITGGRTKGLTDVKPAWRYQAMTELFGPCGIGWKFKETRQWTEPGSESQLMCFANIDLFVKVDGEWSEAIPGTGGSMLVTKEKAGLHTSDDGYKMATTDALSVAMAKIGVAAEIYLGNWDGSKYKNGAKPSQTPKSPPKTSTGYKPVKYLIDKASAAYEASVTVEDYLAAASNIGKARAHFPDDGAYRDALMSYKAAAMARGLSTDEITRVAEAVGCFLLPDPTPDTEKEAANVF